MKKVQLHRVGLREAAQAVRRGDFSSEDLTRALLERIEGGEGRVQAFIWLDPARALDQARAADRALRSGTTPGPLHGIPLGFKDIMETRGIPTGMGSPLYEGHVPASSAAVVRRAEAAGAFVLGKTVTAEFAFFSPGKTRNPWNPAHTPGGSSSGSAAAVAMGFVPGTLGTQTNGSMIRPAAFCGVVGYKPTAGLIPLAGIHPFSPSLDQVGVFARSVPDAALLASVLSGTEDQGRPTSPDVAVIPAELPSLTRPPRLAAVRSPVWHMADPPAQAHFHETAVRLRSAGAEVVERELPPAFAEAHAVLRAIMYAEGARGFAEIQPRARGRLSAVLNGLIDEGLGIADAALAQAVERRGQLVGEMEDFLRGFDGVLTLPAPGEAPADLTRTGDPAFCTIWTLCGVPAVSIPTGRGPRGLPLGLQIAGPRQADGQVLATALWCDEQIAWTPRIAG
jgi:Asp-tRNA(Asn)/Glu-tRNA(Gln) amidotransferase A subunit family amidase